MNETSPPNPLVPSNATRFFNIIVRHWPAVIVVTILALQIGVRLFYPYGMAETGAFSSVADTDYPNRLIIFPLLWLTYSPISNLIQAGLFVPAVTYFWFRWRIRSYHPLIPYVISIAIMIVACFPSFLFAAQLPFYEFQNSVNVNWRAYHLILFTSSDFDNIRAKAVILECGVMGIICRQVYISETLTELTTDQTPMRLIMDETANELQLVIGVETWHTIPIE